MKDKRDLVIRDTGGDLTVTPNTVVTIKQQITPASPSDRAQLRGTIEVPARWDGRILHIDGGNVNVLSQDGVLVETLRCEIARLRALLAEHHALPSSSHHVGDSCPVCNRDARLRQRCTRCGFDVTHLGPISVCPYCNSCPLYVQSNWS